VGKILIRTWQDDDHVSISIADTGGGIPLDIRDKVFDPFFTTKEVGKGTGHGLSLSRAAVERHHGGLSFAGNDTGGTTFTVRLPVAGV
jgi:signal transduction histidine kinase